MPTLADLPDQITEPGYPPLMSWTGFAEWIRMEPGVVKTWIELGHIPTTRIGKRRLVNVLALVDSLREGSL